MFDHPIIMSGLILVGVALGAGVISWIAALVLERIFLQRFGNHGGMNWGEAHRPLFLTAGSLAAFLVLPVTYLSEVHEGLVRHGLTIMTIVTTGWLIIALTSVFGQFMQSSYDIDAKDNRHARAMVTKFAVLKRVWIALVIVCTVGAAFMTFPSIRSVGAGLLASAGFAGIVIGIAARPTVETLLASIQIAITEPISIDDVVIVEGEWGRIQEIRPTYVVVRIWDDRRLIVPLTYFIHQPFQNWTRTHADITGAVTVEVDYRTPVAEVRKAVEKIVTSEEKWDKRFWNLQVTEAGDRTMRLRVLCTAADASAAWDLRCAVREKLIDYLQREHPDALPRQRTIIQGSVDMQREE